jgi:hypothetical protein
MGLSRVFPTAGAVALGGATRLVAPLLLADLARAEAWAVECLRPPDVDVTEASTDDEVREAYDAARAWPPPLGDERVDRLVFGTAEGLAFLLLCGSREDPRTLSHGEAIALLEASTQEQRERLEDVLFGLDSKPFRRVSAEVDRRAEVPPFTPAVEDGGSSPWEEAISRAAGGDPAKLLAFGRLTLGQWRLLNGAEKADGPSDPLPADPDLEALVQTKRRRWWGLPEAPQGPDPVEVGAFVEGLINA